jgi:hypothetical protein
MPFETLQTRSSFRSRTGKWRTHTTPTSNTQNNIVWWRRDEDADETALRFGGEAATTFTERGCFSRGRRESRMRPLCSIGLERMPWNIHSFSRRISCYLSNLPCPLPLHLPFLPIPLHPLLILHGPRAPPLSMMDPSFTPSLEKFTLSLSKGRKFHYSSINPTPHGFCAAALQPAGFSPRRASPRGWTSPLSTSSPRRG